MNGFGLVGLLALRRYVHDLDEATAYFRDLLDFRLVARSSPALARRAGQRSAAFSAGACCIVCTEPLRADSPAGRYLARHPEGIGEVVFRVESAGTALRILEARGATPTRCAPDEDVQGRAFAIATPIDDVEFAFVETDDSARLPGFDPVAEQPAGNRFGFRRFDHLTANFRSMAPMALWCRHVLGFDEYWRVEIHTGPTTPDGSGLRSVVMWDEDADLKIAVNEPLRPRFEASQVARFCRDQRGSGFQHVALTLDDLPHAVEALRARGVAFVPGPDVRYYADLPHRLQALGVGPIEEPVETLADLGILVDGTGPGRYLLQIFMADGMGRFGPRGKTPFFFELIERKGCPGFGENNFRALFEAVERAHRRDLGPGVARSSESCRPARDGHTRGGPH